MRTATNGRHTPFWHNETFTATMIGIGSIISVFFPLFGELVGFAGAFSPLVILLLGVLFLCTCAAYAKLVSRRPDAGGGYVWIHRYLGEKQGYFAGWFSLLAHVVACGAYALAAGEALRQLLYRLFGYAPNVPFHVIAAIAAILLFGWINYRGTKTTGQWGNVITAAGLLIMVAFIVGGGATIIAHPEYLAHNFTTPPLIETHGLGAFGAFLGIFAAMGYFCLAYTGTEIVVQESEEVKNPRQSIVKAIFISMIAVELLYLAVSVVAIGGVYEEGVPSWKILAAAGEEALVEASSRFLPHGDIIILVGWLVLALAALNTTIFSSSHVSFAMSRNRELPSWLSQLTARIGELPTQRTVVFSSALIILFVSFLPLKDIALAADIAFILLFLQTHLAAIAIEKKEPDATPTYQIPWYPWPSVFAIAVFTLLLLRFIPLPFFPSISQNGFLAVLFWGIAGILAYKFWAEPQGEEHLEEETVFKEVVHLGGPGKKKILMPFTDPHETAWRPLLRIAIALAKEVDGDLIVLRIREMLKPESKAQARQRLKPRWPAFRDDTVRIAEETGAPHIVEILYEMHREASQAILETVQVLDCDYLVLGWKGHTDTAGMVFGRTLDTVLREASCNLILVKLLDLEHMKRILVPTTAGPHTRLAGRVATALAREYDGTITVLRVFPQDIAETQQEKLMEETAEALHIPTNITLRAEPRTNSSIVDTIIDAAEAHDVVVIPAGRERLFVDTFVGNTGRETLRRSTKTAILVKHHADINEPLENVWEWLRNRFSSLSQR